MLNISIATLKVIVVTFVCVRVIIISNYSRIKPVFPSKFTNSLSSGFNIIKEGDRPPSSLNQKDVVISL